MTRSVPSNRAVRAAATLAILPLLAACTAARAPLAVAPEPVAPPPVFELFAPTLEPTLDSIVTQAIAERTAPGAAIAVGRHGEIALLKAYGRLDWDPGSPPVDTNSIYDLASLTKLIATTAAAMILEEENRLDLDRTVASYLPEFNAPDKAAITVRMLLTHRAGLEPYASLWRENSGRAAFLSAINARPLERPPGSESEYSDWSMILLQLVIERVTAQPLDVFVRGRITGPLGMNSTTFNPSSDLLPRIAPTEFETSRNTLIHGRVHDPNAYAMGGVSGHAGLFGSVRDLAVFAQMMLSGGHHGSVRIVMPNTVARWTSRQDKGSSRALGWDTPSRNSSAGRFFSPRSFGHTGHTGTSMWIDPVKDLFVVLLTNRVNPTAQNTRHIKLRRDVADAVQSAVGDFPLIEWEPLR